MVVAHVCVLAGLSGCAGQKQKQSEATRSCLISYIPFDRHGWESEQPIARSEVENAARNSFPYSSLKLENFLESANRAPTESPSSVDGMADFRVKIECPNEPGVLYISSSRDVYFDERHVAAKDKVVREFLEELKDRENSQ